MDIAERLGRLAQNLYWVWHPEIVEVFHEINPELWREVKHNPIDFLKRLSREELQEKTTVLALESRIALAFHRLREYLKETNTWGDRHAGCLRASPVVYFSAEFGLHESLPTYAGGLGVLAGDLLKAASDLGIPIVGVGLFYAQGYFKQSINEHGRQQEQYAPADVNILPLSKVLDKSGKPLRIPLQTLDCGTIWVGAWSAHVGRSRLILVDTNVSGNTPEVQALTAQLYGGGNKVRIRQELVLGVGGLRILNAMGIDPGVIHMNEGHSAFATLEITRQLMERDGQSFGNMREKAAAMCVFTTHTPVEAGHDRFEADMVEQTLGPLRQQLGISEAELMAFGRVFPEEPTEKFCMTVLGLKMSRIRNAVSNLHAHLSRAMWRSLWPTREEHEIPIAHITNGVHTGTWLAPEISSFYRRCLGDGWLNRIDDPMTWAAAEGFSDDEFWELKQILKARLITFVRRRVRRQNEARGEAPDKACEGKTLLDPAVLTIGCARRFAQYKRADLLLRDLKRLNQLVNNADRPVQIVYAGKAHPEDEWSKGLLEKVFEVTRDPRFCTRIVFVEDYDIDVARHLVQGVDVWLNNPRRPLEACGTSGQKAVLNGTLNLSVLDGWWAEAYDGTNGFAIGKGSEHSQWDYQDQLDMEMLYKILNEQVVPMFYSRDADGIPKEWTARQKNALRTLAWRFSAQRMVKEYAVNCYLPAAGAVTCSMPACSMSYR